MLNREFSRNCFAVLGQAGILVLAASPLTHVAAQPAGTEARQDAAEMARLVQSYVARGLREMFKENDVVDYWLRPNPKALAACVHWDGIHYQSGVVTYELEFLDVDSPVRIYQYASGGSFQDVSNRAMHGCEARSRLARVCSCQLLFQDERPIYDVPNSAVRRLLTEKSEELRPEPQRAPGMTWRND